MLPLWRKDFPSCPENQNYYRCSSVSYAGCCTHDPCGTGICTAIQSDQASDLCNQVSTLTVTQTAWQGTANNNVGPTSITTPSVSTTGEPTPVADTSITTTVQPTPVVYNSSLGQSDSGSNVSDAFPTLSSSSTHSSPLPTLPVPITHTTSTSTAPGTTKTLSLISSTPSHAASESARPKPDELGPKTTHPGTIAGSVIGSMAGFVLLVGLLFFCLRRKKTVKFTFKRKVQKIENPKELEEVKKERDLALERLEENRQLPSPRSFDFGLPLVCRPSSSPRTPPVPWL